MTSRRDVPASQTRKSGTWTDPRADRSRGLALEVARAILVEEGWDALTHLRVAERSGLNRTTIYRHWPTPLALLQDLLAQESLLTDNSATGDLKNDLIAMLSALDDELAGRHLWQVLTALIDRAQWDPEIRQIKEGLAEQGLAPIQHTLQTAARGGGLVRELDPAVGLAMLVGPLLYRRLISDEEIDANFIDEVVACFVAAYTGAVPEA